MGQTAFADFALGARVLARIAPRSMRLLDLAPAGPEGELRPGLARWGAAAGMGPAPWAARPGFRLGWAPAPDGPAPDPLLAGPLVTPQDAGAVLGFGVAVRGTPTTFA